MPLEAYTFRELTSPQKEKRIHTVKFDLIVRESSSPEFLNYSPEGHTVLVAKAHLGSIIVSIDAISYRFRMDTKENQIKREKYTKWTKTNAIRRITKIFKLHID